MKVASVSTQGRQASSEHQGTGIQPGLRHAVVLGSGITGLLTAWYLRQEGLEVTVLDQAQAPALGASHGNGAQLSYSYVAPLAGPGVLGQAVTWLFNPASPLRWRPRADWRQWRWLMQFAAACNARQSQLTTERLLRLAFYSRDLMHAFLETPQGAGLSFSYRRNGKLVVYSDALALEGARRQVALQAPLGCEQQVLDAQACMDAEPALAHPDCGMGRRMVGGVLTPSEEVGDCHAFCVGLQQLLQQAGVTFHYGFRVEGWRRRPGAGAHAVFGPQGEVEGDAFVIACGAQSAPLGAQIGLDLPVYPLKGYSLTLPESSAMPSLNITDLAKKTVYAPLTGRGLRVAGLVDIVGQDSRLDPARVALLRREVQAAAAPWLPASPDAPCEPWAGLRPATPKGTPVLGATPVANVFVNVGQGALGWTLAHGSARVVADVMLGRKPGLALDGLQYRR